jgi:hypothetical protein
MTGILLSRGYATTTWLPITIQLSDNSSTLLPTDVGVLARSALTGTSGSRRWFLRGAQEDGNFRAPFVGFSTFTSSTVPSHSNLSTNLGDGYGYFIHDYDRVDIVKPTTDGNKYCTMLSHDIVAPPCRTFIMTDDPSGHYVRDREWNSTWVIAFHTTNSANTNLIAILPTIAVPIGIREGRALLYLHNPQSSAITTLFALLVLTPTSTTPTINNTAYTSINIPANTTVVADLGHFSFPPSTTLSHHRSHPLTFIIARGRAYETANSNTVYCLSAIIVPQRAA